MTETKLPVYLKFLYWCDRRVGEIIDWGKQDKEKKLKGDEK